MGQRISVRVIPNASRDELIGWENGCLKVKVQAVPEAGKANKAVCKVIARSIGCRERDIAILSGEHSRMKQIMLPDGYGEHNLPAE